jgi:hypothetical protein
LGGQVVPQLERELWVCSAEAADKMIFKGLDGTFGSIDTMIVWFDKLHTSVVLQHECFDWGCGLVVGDVKDGFISFGCKQVMDLCECG